MSISVLVLGLGASGLAAAHYCAQRPERFGPVVAVDSSPSEKVLACADGLREEGVQVTLGSDRIEGRFDVCVASPGIPPHAPVMKAALQACDEVVSEIEFAYRESSNPWVAITGTNGKTTTTSLIEHLLTTGGVSARAVGNIGAPAIQAVSEAGRDQVMVAEVSSFQLALTSRFHPRVAVLLNLTPDHVDWHGSMERYASDKAKVFANLAADDTAVVDIDDAGSRPYADASRAVGASVKRVSLSDASAEAWLSAGTLCIDEGTTVVELVEVDDLLIKGPHNVSNALAAAAAAHAMGVRPRDLRRGLRTFQPIEHRLEPAGVALGIEWFNDSKATNPDAVSKAIGAFADRPYLLLLGGRNKGNDFRRLALEAKTAKAVVAFGEARRDIAQAFAEAGSAVVEAAGLCEAVQRAAELASPGDAVVLSPACASFDEFVNYEERGRRFKDMVARMRESES